MSFLGGGGGDSTTRSVAEPYAAAQPALNQILSEATTLYGQGAGATGYVAPTQQTLTGLATQEALGTAAAGQLAGTIAGQYTNPFLSPFIQGVAGDVYSNVASQFSGAGRTPTSPMAQQSVVEQVAAQALPLAFQSYESERGRQLQTAQEIPSLIQTGAALEQLQRAEQLAPFQALQQYAGIVSPIAAGFPVQQGATDVSPDRLTQLLGAGVILKGLL
jgi:hypothetical protein